MTWLWRLFRRRTVTIHLRAHGPVVIDPDKPETTHIIGDHADQENQPMTKQRDDLARDLSAAYGSMDGEVTPADVRAADGLIVAGWTRPRTVSTAEELSKLPTDSVVMSESIAYQYYRGGDWTADGRWFKAGQIKLPATVLHEPVDSQ